MEKKFFYAVAKDFVPFSQYKKCRVCPEKTDIGFFLKIGLRSSYRLIMRIQWVQYMRERRFFFMRLLRISNIGFW